MDIKEIVTHRQHNEQYRPKSNHLPIGWGEIQPLRGYDPEQSDIYIGIQNDIDELRAPKIHTNSDTGRDEYQPKSDIPGDIGRKK
jgi:hypothetical protein